MFLPDSTLILFQLFTIAILFFVLIPLTAALQVRSRWKRFRTSLLDSLLLPTARPSIHPDKGRLGPHKFLGELDAIEGQDILWIKGSHGTVTADMRDAKVYKMTDMDKNDQIYEHLSPYPLPNKSLTSMAWADVFSLTEGTKLFLYGDLSVSNGKALFSSIPGQPLTVLLYDEDPFALIPRTLWSGRQENELWNSWTPWSIATGSLLLMIASVLLMQESTNYFLQILSLSLALLPVIIFLPPGVFSFNLYKSFWDKGRRFRAERDLMLLPPHIGKRVKDGHILYQRQPSLWQAGDENHPVLIELPEDLMLLCGKKDFPACVSFPAEPAELSQFCQRKAAFYEILASFLLISGLLMNYFLIWMLFILLY